MESRVTTYQNAGLGRAVLTFTSGVGGVAPRPAMRVGRNHGPEWCGNRSRPSPPGVWPSAPAERRVAVAPTPATRPPDGQQAVDVGLALAAQRAGARLTPHRTSGSCVLTQFWATQARAPAGTAVGTLRRLRWPWRQYDRSDPPDTARAAASHHPLRRTPWLDRSLQ